MEQSWPPRVWISSEGTEGEYWFDAYRDQTDGAAEYISLAESNALVAKARAEVLDILRVVHGSSEPARQRYPYFLVSGFLAKASEGVSE